MQFLSHVCLICKIENLHRANWGKDWSSYLLQAFMEAAVGVDRLQVISKKMEAFQAEIQQSFDRERERAERLALEGGGY